MKLSSRDIAIAAGQIYYASGKKCKYEHIDSRYTKSGVCVECHKMRSKAKAESVRKAFMGKGLGLVQIDMAVHPEDVATVESFIKSLLFDRGIY